MVDSIARAYSSCAEREASVNYKRILIHSKTRTSKPSAYESDALSVAPRDQIPTERFRSDRVYRIFNCTKVVDVAKCFACVTFC